jgi:signal peptidase I
VRRRVLIGLVVGVGVLLASLRFLGLIRPFKVPTGAMTPTISQGDHFLMEGFTFLARKPRRGDVLVFRTDSIESLQSGIIYIKRLVGEPGERLRISDGRLFVNDKQVSIRNTTGEVHYVFMRWSHYLTSVDDSVMVPDGHYFVLGYNSTNSSDSRIWGFVPAGNVMGRASLRYWPPGRIGGVK